MLGFIDVLGRSALSQALERRRSSVQTDFPCKAALWQAPASAGCRRHCLKESRDGRLEPPTIGSGKERRQLRAADAALADRAGRQGLSPACVGDSRAAPIHLGANLRALPAAGLGVAGSRHRQRRHGGDDGGEYARDVRGALRRADVGRGPQHPQHPPRRAGARLLPAPRSRQGADHRSRVCRHHRRGARRGRRRDPGHRHRRSARRQPGPELGRIDYEQLLDGGDPQFAWRGPADEWNAICSQLHLRHDRRSEGRRLPSPRRLPDRHRQRFVLGDAAAPRLSVDAADVPLQRLVLPLDAGGDRRNQRLRARVHRPEHLGEHRGHLASPTSAARRSSSTWS